MLEKEREKMKYCPNCGKPVDDAHPFCSSCGYKFPTFDAAPVNNSYAYQTPPEFIQVPDKTKGSKRALIIALAAAAVLVILAALFFVTNIFGNHVMIATEVRHYNDGELYLKVERKFDGSDMTEETQYYYDGKDVTFKRIGTYEYDGKHNRTGFTIETVSYDEYGKVEETDKYEYDIKSYKKDGLWHYDVYGSYGNLLDTDVYDKHREVIQNIDDDGSISYEAKYEYDIFGRLISLKDIRHDSDDSVWYEMKFTHDDGKMIATYSDAYDWDERTDYYENYEAVYEWSFYYFW